MNGITILSSFSSPSKAIFLAAFFVRSIFIYTPFSHLGSDAVSLPYTADLQAFTPGTAYSKQKPPVSFSHDSPPELPHKTVAGGRAHKQCGFELSCAADYRQLPAVFQYNPVFFPDAAGVLHIHVRENQLIDCDMPNDRGYPALGVFYGLRILFTGEIKQTVDSLFPIEHLFSETVPIMLSGLFSQ